MLAGGLNTLNITAALQEARPYGVDVNSGVEVAPGIKDHHLIREFVRTVREFDDQDV
jgi:phosphoribosylanthranilate isomerase